MVLRCTLNIEYKLKRGQQVKGWGSCVQTQKNEIWKMKYENLYDFFKPEKPQNFNPVNHSNLSLTLVKVINEIGIGLFWNLSDIMINGLFVWGAIRSWFSISNLMSTRVKNSCKTVQN